MPGADHPFLDTGVLVAYMVGGTARHKRSRALLSSIERGSVSAWTTEIAGRAEWTLHTILPRTPRGRIAAGLLEIISLPGIQIGEKEAVVLGTRQLRRPRDRHCGRLPRGTAAPAGDRDHLQLRLRLRSHTGLTRAEP